MMITGEWREQSFPAFLVYTPRHRLYGLALWRELAAENAAHIRWIDLTGIAGEADMVIHAYHYVPSILQRMAGMMDDWYEAVRG